MVLLEMMEVKNRTGEKRGRLSQGWKKQAVRESVSILRVLPVSAWVLGVHPLLSWEKGESVTLHTPVTVYGSLFLYVSSGAS